jgi:hypothetical protein
MKLIFLGQGSWQGSWQRFLAGFFDSFLDSFLGSVLRIFCADLPVKPGLRAARTTNSSAGAVARKLHRVQSRML